MAASVESEAALNRFVETHASSVKLQLSLHEISSLEELKSAINQIEPGLTGAALIPLEQATSPAKIVVDSGVLSENIPWRLLRCPGGPLVLQMICKKVNFATWIEAC